MTKISYPENLVKEEHKKKAEKFVAQFAARKDIGFPELPYREEIWAQAAAAAENLKKACRQLVVVGIGGSSLGSRVFTEVFHQNNVFFVDNVDDAEFSILWESLSLKWELVDALKDVGWAFISKSGNTIETLCALEFVIQKYESVGLVLNDTNTVVISEMKPSSLPNWAQQRGIPVLEVPVDVGGRFSVLSSVGLFTAAFIGLDLYKLRYGALRALKEQEKVVDMVAIYLASFDRQEWLSCFWIYCSSMKNFGFWLQQLWSESLAKSVDRNGKPAPRVSTPWTLIGATDQHSVLQQIMEGPKDKMVMFLRFGTAEAGHETLSRSHFEETKNLVTQPMGYLLKTEAEATEEALKTQGLSTCRLWTKVLDEESLGYLFMFFELVVAGLGEALDINAFDQPGVELGKRLAKAKLAAGGKP